jgi:hypothetical protein
MGRKASRSKPWTEEHVKIGPVLAQKFLGMARANRPNRKAKIVRFADTMSSKKWTYQYPGIQFYPNKVLADGEHRLKAIIKAGVEVEMPVHHNVPFNAKPNLDTGSNRTADDMLALEQRDDLGKHAGGVIKQIRFGAHDGGRGPISNAEVIEYANLYGKGIRAVNRMLDGKPKRIVSTAPVKGCLVKAWYSRPKDRGRIKYFADLLVNGASLPGMTGEELEHRAKTYEDHIRALDSWLSNLSSPREGASVRKVYKAVERTLKTFLDGGVISQRFRPLKFDAFPLKDEPAAPRVVYWLPKGIEVA